MDIKTLLQLDRQRIANNRRAYLEYLLNEALLDDLAVEEAARQRQYYEEVKKRAVEEMTRLKEEEEEAAKKIDSKKKQEAGAKVISPMLQPSSFVPDSNFVQASQLTVKLAQNINNTPFYKIPTTDPLEQYYPKSWVDQPGRLTYNPQTLKPYWGLTVREQQELGEVIQNQPTISRSPNEFDYYDQLTRQYMQTNQNVAGATEDEGDITTADVFGTAGRILSRNPLGGPLPAAAFIDYATGNHLGISNWLDNTLSYFNINKNESEIGGYQGDIDMNDELRAYIKNIVDYLNLTKDLRDARAQLLTMDPKNTAGRSYIETYIKNMESRLPDAEKAVDVAISYINKKQTVSEAKLALYRMALGAAIDPHAIGRDLFINQATDSRISKNILKLVDQYKSELAIGDSEKIEQSSKAVNNELQKILAQLDEEDFESREGMRKNIQELEDWKKWHTPDPEYVAKAQSAAQDMSFIDPNTYLFGLPGILGSSASFNLLQWANTALSMTAGVIAQRGGGAGLAAAAPMLAGGQALGLESAHRENAAEVVEHVNSKFQEQLKKADKLDEFLSAANKASGKELTFEEAMREMALGRFTPSEEIKKIYTNSLFGSNNLFMHDMLAVTGENLFDAIVNFVPFGKFADASWLRPVTRQIGKLKRLSAFKAAHPELYAKTVTNGGKFGTNTYDFVTNNFSESWYNFGASINPVVGLGTATFGAVTKPLREPVLKYVSKNVTEQLSKKFGTIADWAYKAPKKLLDARVIGRTGKDWLARTIATSYSESIEEGKQYYHGKEFAAGNYAGESDSMWDLLLGDIEGGSKSALQFAGSFLGLSSDKEWISNMRGGFLAGGGHTAIMSGYGNFSGAVKEINANHLVVNNILSTKMQERSDIMKGIQYAKRSSFADRKAMMTAFDNVAQLLQQITDRGKELGNPDMEGIASELIEEQRKLYNRIFNIANNDFIKQAARVRGIKPGSDRYATYVSLINFALQEADKAASGFTHKLADILKTINQSLWGIDDVDLATDDELLEIAQNAGIHYKRSTSPTLTNEAIAENRKNRRNAILNRRALVDFIAHLDALLSYRDLLELKDNKTEADKRKLRSINSQIENLRNTVRDSEEVVDEEGNKTKKYHDNMWSVINGASELQQYVQDIDLHEVIRDQYRDVINFLIDLDHANGMQYNLLGIVDEGSPKIDNGQIQDIVDKVESQAKQQYKNAAAVTDNSDITVTDRGLSHGQLNEKAAKKANDIIDRYLKSVKDDEQFNQEIQDDFQRALDTLYSETEQEIISPERKTEEPESPKPPVSPSPTSGTQVPVPDETNPDTVDFGDITDYVYEFNLRPIPNDVADKVSQQLKLQAEQLVNDFNLWIKDAHLAQHRTGGTKVYLKDRKDLIERYNNLIDRSYVINDQIDNELSLIASQQDKPQTDVVPSITEEDIIDAIIKPMDKWLNDIKATAEHHLTELLKFIQTVNNNTDLLVTEQTANYIKQIIANLDEIFRLVELLGLDIVTAGALTWYFGTQQVSGARKIALEAMNAVSQALPKAVIPDGYMPDLNSWLIFSRTEYELPKLTRSAKHGTGIKESVATDDKNIKLVDVIGDPNFVEEAKFEFILLGNNQPFVVIRYKGHEFTPVFVQTAAFLNKSVGYYFWNLIKKAFYSKRNDQRIVPSFVYRSPGKPIFRDANGNLLEPKTLVEVGLINDGNMYQLEFSANLTTFGITQQVMNSENIAVTRVYVPSESGRGHNWIYEYSNSSLDGVPTPGTPMFIYDRKFSERGNRRTDVPILTLFTKLTEGDANLIVEILQGVHCADKNAHGAGILGQQYVQEDGKGNLIEYGITNGEVLRMLMRFGAYKHNMHQLHLEFKPEDNRFVKIVGFFEGEGKFDPNKPNEIPVREYNIHDDNDIKRFMNDIVGVVSRNFDEGVASSRVGDNFDTKSHFYKLNQKRQNSPALLKMLDVNGQLLFGKSSIIFDKKDFEDVNDPNSRGVSGMVWYARHGFIMTRFNGFENTILIFDENAGIRLVDGQDNTLASATVAERVSSQNEQLLQNAQVETEPTPVVDNSPQADQEAPKPRPTNRKRIIEADDDEFRKTVNSLPNEKDRINISEAKKHLMDILGDRYYQFGSLDDDKTEQQMIQMFKNGPVSLGTCSLALIQLSKYAAKGTEYHEAFHFIVEYLMNDRQRMKLYEAYAKAKNIKLKDSDGNIIVSNMKIVTEGLANEYMMYNMDRPTIKLSLNLKESLKSIKTWANFFRSIGSARLLWTYIRANHGKYKNIKPSESNIARAKRVLEKYKQNKFNFTVRQHKFDNILNNRHYRYLCETMVYIIIQSQDTIDVAGRNISELKMKDADVIREYKLFKKYSQDEPALSEMLDNWDVVSKDVQALIAQIAEPNKSAHDEEENVEDILGDEESLLRGALDDHTKNSNEFSQFSRATDMVKYFFATIPNVKWAYNEEGDRIRQMVLNGAGLPSFVKAQVMYNTVLNQVYNCRSLQALIDKLESLGKENAQFAIIAKRFVDLRDSANNGNVDDAALLTQLCVNLHASKGEYITVRAHRDKAGNYDISILPSDGNSGPRNIRSQWSRQFAGGASSYIKQDADGNYVMKNNFKPSVFKTLAKFMFDFQRAVSDVGIQAIGDNSKLQFTVPVLVDGKLTERILDVTDPIDLQLAKSKLISILNKLGITFTIDALNYMLNTRYGSSDYAAMNKLFTDNKQESIQSFATFIQNFEIDGKLNIQNTPDGYTINSVLINEVFNKAGSGFVGMLANWSYNYKKSTDQLSILANKGNRQYLISENNYLTDSIDDMNASIQGDSQKIDDLKSFVYNWYQEDGQGLCGSIILKNFSSNSAKKIAFITDLGFRTDEKGDLGEDYSEITQLLDEVSKIEMLLLGKIIFPTMSDKKTWGYIDGIHLPGLNFNDRLAELINTIEIKPNGSYILHQNDAVLEQLRQYAELEYQAVIKTLKDVKGYTDPVTGMRISPMQDSEKIDNYHKAKVKVRGKSYEIIQGARFSSLYAIYDSKGRKISFNRVCDANGNFISEEDNIATAMERFFGVPSETDGMFWIYDDDGKYVEVSREELHKKQKAILLRSLLAQFRKQMQKAEKLGLIQNTGAKGPYVYKFKNKLLNNSKLNSIKSAININGITEEQKESLAICIMLNDASCKSITSLQEIERVFSGHPAFYKWVYNSKGELADRSTDQYKRFGGLVSTGLNNAFVFKDLPTKYTAAEVDDFMVESSQIEDVRKLMYEGELRSTYLRKLLKDAGITMELSNSDDAKRLAKKADESSLEDIEKSLDDVTLAVVRRRSKQKINSFRKSEEENLKGINVADGATYITDDMCENLLKQVGSYSKEIKHAFKVLRGETVGGRKYTTKDVREMAAAYELITTTVVGTQKYTAYGFRKQGGLLVPYYNKTALFPLFKSICTGKTAELFDKMKKQHVDMVMFKSAVKVGSQGSQKIDWNNFDSFTFNKYEQEYRYLRKQFNTDPKEKELMAMGTLMTKIIFSSILPGRDYVITNPDGTKTVVNAKYLRDSIMESIKALSDIGYKELRERLFDGDHLNVVAFSNFLTEELANRGASREMLDAVSVVDENTPNIDPTRKEMLKQSGKKELKVPLAAMSNMSWIQSIINSKVNKSVIDINTPGAAFIQRSVFGMEGPTMVSDENLPPSIYEGRKLAFRNENGSMDCVLSIDFFKNIIPKGLSFAEARQWLIENKIISGRLKDGTWSDADASIVGYRIPTQAQSSIHALRVVDVIETVNDTIVLPEDFTAITGADFDIDKLFLSTFFYKNDGNGNATKVYEKGTKEAVVNELIAMQLSLLKDSKSLDNSETRAMHSGDGPIDSDTKLLTDIIDDLLGDRQEELDPYDTYSLWKNTSVRNNFITGKFGIGPFALNNNNHILTMLYGVNFRSKKGSILTIIGKNSLHDSEDMYGESIMSWLSGLINAHVDIAKDPFIPELNVNSYTYNLVNLMVRVGFGKKTFHFMTLPIMRELAEVVNNAASAYGADKNKSKYRRQKDAEERFILGYASDYLGKDYNDVEELLQAIKDHFNKKGVSYPDLYKSIFDPKSNVLHDISKSGDDIYSDSLYKVETKRGPIMLDMQELQLLVYLAKADFDPYSLALSSLVKYCKIDTKKQGKNISEQRDFVRGYKKLFEDPRSGLHKLFEPLSLFNLQYGSYVAVKTKNATKLFEDILADLLLEATPAFEQSALMVVQLLNIDEDEITLDVIDKVLDSILVSIRSGYFNQYANKFGINIRGLVNGENTIYDKLNNIKNKILSDPEYEYLRGEDGSINNYLLDTLTSGFTHKLARTISEEEGTVNIPAKDTYPDAKFISTLVFMDDDSIDQDEMILSWEDLLEDSEHPELQQFARELIVYAFITTGGNGGANNIFKYIPTSWLVNPDNSGYTNSYAYHMAQILENYRYNRQPLFNEDVDDIILNNWTDYRFIPSVDISKVDKFYSGNPSIDVNEYGQMVAPEVDIPLVIRVSPTVSNSRFIKINRDHDPLSQRSVAIYKKIDSWGYKKVGDKFEQVQTYVLVEPKGQNFYNKNKIYEYGRSDSAVEEQSSLLSKLMKKNGKFESIVLALGADPHNIEDILNKFVKFVLDKNNKSEAVLVLADYKTPQPLLDAIVENSINVELRLAADLGMFDLAFAEDWSKKEGWSVEYFNDVVFPKINEAWQIEYELAEDQSIQTDKTASMTYRYGSYKRDDISSETTLDAIKAGERTATTRYTSDGNIEFWLGLNVGDFVKFHDDDGNSVIVRITKKATNLFEQFYDNTGAVPFPYDQQERTFEPLSPEDSDKLQKATVIWAHPGIGKTYLHEQGRTDVIDFDSEYKSRLNELFGLPKDASAKQLRLAVTKDREQEYHDLVMDLFDEAVKDAKESGRKLLVSDMMLLREREDDIDAFINMSSEKFIERSRLRGDTNESDMMNWKNNIDKTLEKIEDLSKIINTDAFLELILPEQQISDDFVYMVNDVVENSDGNKTIHYSEWKRMLETRQKLYDEDNSINQFEVFVSDLEDWLDTNNYISRPTYNKSTKQLTVDMVEYNLVKYFLDNFNSLKKELASFNGSIDEFFDFTLTYSGDVDAYNHRNDRILDINTQVDNYVKNELSDDLVDDKFVNKLTKRGNFETTSDKVLSYIESTGKYPVSSSLKKYVEKHPIKIIFTTLAERGPKVGGRTSGYYGPNGIHYDAIYIYTSSEDFKHHPIKTILHEITHSVSSAVVDILEKLYDDKDLKFLNGVIKYAVDYIDNNVDINELALKHGIEASSITDVIYGFTSPSEFVAEVMSNKNLQAVLKGIPAMKEKQFNNIFEELVYMFAKLIDRILGRSTDGTLLQQIEPVLRGIFETQYELDYNKPLVPQLNNILKRPSTQLDETFEKNKSDSFIIKNTPLYREMQSIKEKAIADGTFMKAPNGKPTNLNERQWLQVRTKAFKDWFGDWENDPTNASKVVDENGEPLVVYRGGNLETRNGAYYFTPSKDYASRYTDLEGGETLSFFLNIKEINNINGSTPIIRSDGKKVASRGLFENPWNEEDINILLNGKDGAYSDGEYLVNSLNQIKSATDNNGEFSKKNDDVYLLNDIIKTKLFNSLKALKALGEDLMKKCNQ